MTKDNLNKSYKKRNQSGSNADQSINKIDSRFDKNTNLTNNANSIKKPSKKFFSTDSTNSSDEEFSESNECLNDQLDSDDEEENLDESEKNSSDEENSQDLSSSELFDDELSDDNSQNLKNGSQNIFKGGRTTKNNIGASKIIISKSQDNYSDNSSDNSDNSDQSDDSNYSTTCSDDSDYSDDSDRERVSKKYIKKAYKVPHPHELKSNKLAENHDKRFLVIRKSNNSEDVVTLKAIRLNDSSKNKNIVQHYKDKYIGNLHHEEMCMHSNSNSNPHSHSQRSSSHKFSHKVMKSSKSHEENHGEKKKSKKSKNKHDSNEIFTELINKQIVNVPSSWKLSIGDMKRICKYIDTSIFDPDECCIWNGYITNIHNSTKGTYVNFYFKNKKVALHRLLYSNFVAPIDSTDYLKFNCENKGICCNINHYEKYKYSKTSKIKGKEDTQKENKKENKGIVMIDSFNSSDSQEDLLMLKFDDF